MVRNIAIIGKDNVYRDKVNKSLQQLDQFFCYPIDTADRALAAMASGFYHGFVLVFEQLGLRQIEMIDKLKTQYPDISLVLVSPKGNTSMKTSVKKYPKTFFIDIDSDLDNISGVILKLIEGEDVFYRQGSRFRTHTYAQVGQIYSAKEELDRNATIHNLSHSGAFISSRLKSLKVGDNIFLTVPTVMNKRVVRAKVVWSKALDEGQNPMWNYGLEF